VPTLYAWTLIPPLDSAANTNTAGEYEENRNANIKKKIPSFFILKYASLIFINKFAKTFLAYNSQEKY
jgi:hypothetical protein